MLKGQILIFFYQKFYYGNLLFHDESDVAVVFYGVY